MLKQNHTQVVKEFLNSHLSTKTILIQLLLKYNN